VLGSSAQRSAGSEYSSRSRGPLRRRLVVSLLAVAAIALVTGTLRGVGPLQHAQGVGSDAMRPFEVAAHRVASPFVDTYDYFSELFAAKGQVEDMRKDLEAARELAAQNAAAASENAELRKMVRYHGLPSVPHDYEGVFTAVMTHGWPEPASLVTIGAGTKDGIRVGDAVTNVNGYLVGTITAVAGSTARATLLTDPAIAVSARDTESTAEGLVVSDVDNQGGIRLFLDRVPKAARIIEGDEITTAGWHFQDISSLYPRGIPIGRVASVSQNDVEASQQIQLTPFANLNALENVVVLVPKEREARK
jgi:rod shape-determining protein MreC